MQFYHVDCKKAKNFALNRQMVGYLKQESYAMTVNCSNIESDCTGCKCEAKKQVTKVKHMSNNLDGDIISPKIDHRLDPYVYYEAIIK